MTFKGLHKQRSETAMPSARRRNASVPTPNVASSDFDSNVCALNKLNNVSNQTAQQQLGGETRRTGEVAFVDAIAYRVILEPDEDGFRAIIPAFPRVFTCGDNVEDTLAMASDAISLELAVMLENGEEIPDPDGDAEIRVERVVVTPPAA